MLLKENRRLPCLLLSLKNIKIFLLPGGAFLIFTFIMTFFDRFLLVMTGSV